MHKETQIFENMQYVIRYPKNHVEGEKYPVLLFLHGAGTRGTDIQLLHNNAFFNLTAEHKDFPFICVAPLCHENTWFDLFQNLKSFVGHILTMPCTDPERLYLIGNSMGGYATWALAMSMPEYFAAIVPICGGGMYWNAARLVNTPVWAFHGGKDNVVFVEESVKLVDAVNANGGNAKLTIYPEHMHDSWSDTYKNEQVFQWLLSHKNSNAKAIENICADAKIYG